MNRKCEILHKWFNSMRRFTFPFEQDLGSIPKNGIYVLFENGEKCFDSDRVVRIGTHTGDNQLKSRLKQHFMNENKDRSIFRKNIGRCIINIEQNPYESIWEIDFTTKKNKTEYGHLRDEVFQSEIENKISKHIQENLSFVIIEINDKIERLNMESKLISTISMCEMCAPSENWLGHNSTKSKIRKSGLWQVNELYKEMLSQNDMDRLEHLIKNTKIKYGV